MGPLTVAQILEHHGVKGMRWGVHEEPEIDASLHHATRSGAKEVAHQIAHRYGFQVTGIKDLKIANPKEHIRGTLGYVQGTPGKRGGVIYLAPEDTRKALKGAENVQWFAPGTGNVKAFVTHEAMHAMFHAEQSKKPGIFKTHIKGGSIEARDRALMAAVVQAKKDGVKFSPDTISGYAAASGSREEAEAELFSQYHWSPNAPNHVKAWGETLHHELGVDPTPFRKAVKRE